MGRQLRARQRVDYAKALHKYDKFGFERPKTVQLKRRIAPTVPGRANSAPTLQSWPFDGMHQDVQYVEDIDDSLQWEVQLPNDVHLPFAYLDRDGEHKWQGLIQKVQMNGSAAVRSHFDAVADAMRLARSNPAITECVGEAAAAIAMLEAGGWEMIWGFHMHSGTGIDQIWRRATTNGKHDYHIVEAKGPGASLNQGTWVPPDYAQMQFGWVVNHLKSMEHRHAVGRQICADLQLAFVEKHKNFDGATKSYFGLAPSSRHATAGVHLTGVVVTARWDADGRLRYDASELINYI